MRCAVFVCVLLLLRAVALGESLDLPCTADTSIVLYQGEKEHCHGAKPWLRLKGNQHLLVLAFDVTPLRGRVVQSAWIKATAGDAAVRGVSVSTIAAPWREATANALSSGEKDGWGVAGVRFPAVCGGNAGTLVTHSRCVVQ